jgi:TolB-like protein/Tfp pilus assembly protein PilF
MSPEQIQGHEIDQRSDLFAFGIILYEMITGQHPWPRESSVDTLHAILHSDPPPVQLAPPAGTELGEVVRKLLCKNPAERYPFAEAVLEALASRSAGEGSGSVRPATPKTLTSIAVLPFVFLSEVDERRGLSLGFADALITLLSNLEDVAVAPTSAILNYIPGAEPARVCRDLGVRHVLQGTVQHLGARWRVTLQLFDGMTQKIAFSEKHDLAMEDVFDVQDEIGRRVVASLQSRFSPAVGKSRDRYSGNAEAFDEFMSGLHESYSNRLETLESAVRHLSRAVECDPAFGLAHATLSYVAMSIHFQFDPLHTWLETAEHHCQRALTLDPALPEGHLARSWILWSAAKNFQHAEAIAALEQVLAAQPNSERAHNRMASICLHIGRLKEARIAHEHAQRSNPKTRSFNLDYFYLYSGDFTRFEEATQAHMSEKPVTMYALEGHVLPPLYSGDLELAWERLAAAMNELPDEPTLFGMQAMLHARNKQTGLALQCVQKALDSPSSFGHTHHVYHYIASAYAVLGDTDKAMKWLERTVDTGFACWPFFRIDPYLESLREQPKFKQLIAHLEHKFTALEIHRL